MTRSFAIPIFALAAALALAAAPATAAGERAYAAAIGAVSMPRETTTDASGVAHVTANVHLNASVARDAGARYVLLSLGNDAATRLIVEELDVKTAAGESLQPERPENEGTNRAQWWYDARALPATADLVLTASVKGVRTRVDVETLVMAFNAQYGAVNGPGGKPLTVQTWTTVLGPAAPTNPTNPTNPTTPTPPTTPTDPTPPTTPTTPTDPTPPTDGGSQFEEAPPTPETKKRGAPGFEGVAAVGALAAGVAAASLIRRRRT